MFQIVIRRNELKAVTRDSLGIQLYNSLDKSLDILEGVPLHRLQRLSCLSEISIFQTCVMEQSKWSSRSTLLSCHQGNYPVTQNGSCDNPSFPGSQQNCTLISSNFSIVNEGKLFHNHQQSTKTLYRWPQADIPKFFLWPILF